MEKMFKPKKCKMCGKEFVPNCGVQVYCSYDCKRESKNAWFRTYYEQHHCPVYGYCKFCGKKFEKKGNKTFCCPEHREEYWKNRDNQNHKRRYIPVEPHETVCKACGKTFLGKWGAKYCTDCCPDRYYANRTVNLEGAFDVPV